MYYGTGCCDTFSLDHYLSKVILRNLQGFRDDLVRLPSYPAEMKSVEEWLEIIDQMIWSHSEIANSFPGEPDIREGGPEKMTAYYEKVQKGLDLFAKHYMNLWL